MLDCAPILLVEDDFIICEVYTHFIKKLGFEVKAVSTGKAALSALTQQTYSAVILDLELPDIQGETILLTVRTHQKNPSIPYLPVIVTTSTTDPQRMKHCQAQGADAYLTKPVNFYTFKTTLINLGLSIDII